jgi:adenine-specific DNA-methyltransferase
MARKQKLELTWIGKENRSRIEPRILIERDDLSYHAKEKHSENDIFDNMLIHGDNLLALKALEQEYFGRIDLIFIDPPYNTGSAFEHYDDGIEHSLWLSLMRDRLEILWNLLNDQGSIWITIDDEECHYLKILCDECFGRSSFVSSIAWEKDKGRRSDTAISSAHDHILLYVKDKPNWKHVRNLLPRTADQEKRYRNPDNDPKGPWLQGDNSTTKSGTEKQRFKVTLPSGREVRPPAGRYWGFTPESLERAKQEGRVYFGANGDGMPIIKRYLTEVQGGVVPRTFWTADEAGHNQEAKRDHLNKLLKGITPFDTPKPERLLERILTIASKPGQLVLDSFLGSGTTAAVAHKMGRRWIGIELGAHCFTHCIPRLKKVVDGEDPWGITVSPNTKPVVVLCKDCREALCEQCSEKVGESDKGGEIRWNGGGGFRFFELGPSLIAEDQWGNPIINPDFNPAMLAEAMCKIEGFTYAPSDEIYWIHGHSTETDFIYVTTQFMSREMLTMISDEVGPERSLLVCCTAFKCDPGEFTNLTLEKIPKAVLKKCEWGHDDYSLAVENLPEAPPGSEMEAEPQKEKESRTFGKVAQQASLFDQPQGDE